MDPPPISHTVAGLFIGVSPGSCPNDSDRAITALREGRPGQLASDPVPSSIPYTRSGVRRSAMGMEKSQAILGGHWGGRPPQGSVQS